jgi:hypothetical protein
VLARLGVGVMCGLCVDVGAWAAPRPAPIICMCARSLRRHLRVGVRMWVWVDVWMLDGMMMIMMEFELGLGL